ncbi:SUMF1/EgtB/PvdO family nonheme iron enzyme [Simkania negevensis]|uniref:non-specific serine/threonine protein kinase n=1 Tax=Simkania negevensis TaxID=83561 RepID=A0ABS3AV71_9BACT|nr:SUMF1/EgtB/PvdO family nonheme iron enzyme [Simkania negevensis]
MNEQSSSKVLGDYKIIRQMGQGVFGGVYLAEHRFIKRQYLLKVLPEELACNRNFIQRFEEYVGYLASLEHPNIVRIHNISFAQGLYFLVCDCVVNVIGETINLAQYMHELAAPLKEGKVELFLRQVAAALDYAHDKQTLQGGIAHLGLKLNNILVGRGKEGESLQLSDFGLTKIIGPASFLSRLYKNLSDALGVQPVVTSSSTGEDLYSGAVFDSEKLALLHNAFLQSYLFLAPEQKRVNDLQGVEEKVDSYAFGILAYFLLTQKYPEGAFEMPSECRPELVNGWDSLVMCCLHPNPANRPSSLVKAMDELLLATGTTDSPVEKIQEEQPLSYQSNLSELDMRLPASSPPSSAFVNPNPTLSLPQASLEPLSSPPISVEESAAATCQQAAPKNVTAPILEQQEASVATLNIPQQIVYSSDKQVTHYVPQKNENKVVEPLSTEMVTIKGGTFLRGSYDGNRDEMPKHQIELDAFCIDIHCVTNEQFIRFLEYLAGEKDSQNHDIIRFKESRIRKRSGKLSIESGYSKHPLVGVTWYGAVAYAKWLGKRLPTEAEWEIASRGGVENAIYPTGERIEKKHANFFSSDSTAVMSYAPNGYKLYDIIGNVYEWCQDWYGYNYYEVSVQEPYNPTGPIQGVYRVLRGGCWKSLKEDLRCSHRHRNNPGTFNATCGFRCAKNA